VLALDDLVHAVAAAVDHVDHRLIETLAAHRRGWATLLADGPLFIGTTPAGLGLLCVAVALVIAALRAYRAAIVAGVALVLAMLAAQGLKSLFERPRPPADLALATAPGWSFPSTQAAETSAIAASLVVLLLVGPGWGPRVSAVLSRRAQVWLAVALVAAVGLVGVCMVYLGAHWLSDVLAGWLLGTAIGVTVGWFGGRLGGRVGVGSG
jgi:undecaprenyl-diphosphatase